MNHFKHTKTYRYKFIESKNHQSGKKLLVCLHGYGQLVHYFSRKFEIIEKDYSMLFPEGMHRFYLKGNTGKVGASWMTREDRLSDIEDNVHWLSELIRQIQSHHNYTKIILLGFSQGGSTAIRLFNSFPNLFNQLIIWASDFPPDISIINKKDFNGVFLVGKRDKYFKEILNQTIDSYQRKGFNTIVFDGIHDIHAETLLKLMTS